MIKRKVRKGSHWSRDQKGTIRSDRTRAEVVAFKWMDGCPNFRGLFRTVLVGKDGKLKRRWSCTVKLRNEFCETGYATTILRSVAAAKKLLGE